MNSHVRWIGLLPLAVVLALAVQAAAVSVVPVAAEPNDGGGIHLSGLCFSPYMPGQGPDRTGPLPPDQVRSRLAVVAPVTDWVRSYGTENGLETIGRFSHELGRKVAVGAWLGRDRAANERQIAGLIAIGKAGQADVLIVGSETLLRGDLSEAELLGAIARVRRAVPGVPVTTAETYNIYLDHPALFGAVDQVYVHIYPFWNGVGIDRAVTAAGEAYTRVEQKAGGRPVIVAETGWPSAGEPNGAAVPSAANAERYFREFTAWAKGRQVPYFYFEAFDEAWKAQHEGERGAHWGLWDQNAHPKNGLLVAATPSVTVTPAITEPAVVPPATRTFGRRYAIGPLSVSPSRVSSVPEARIGLPAGSGRTGVGSGAITPPPGGFVRWYPAARWRAGPR
jgi:exo-beta-1,3-glucanase (GH17 family)